LIAARPFNVLITSLSDKVPLIREVRQALVRMNPDGRVMGADCNPACMGRYFVDDFWQMPSTDRLDPDDVVRYCKAQKIRSIIPTRDGELLFFAASRERLMEKGIAVLIASPKAVTICLDKKMFFDVLNLTNELNPIPTLERPDSDLAERWVVKERYGAGSKNMRINVSVEAARSLVNQFANLICQPYIKGQEYSVDLYISRNGHPKGGVVRKRDVVLDGESQVTTTADRSDIVHVCLKAADTIGLTGHVLFQLIEDESGSLNLIECNCRFGGASTLSVAAGLDSFHWFFRECLGDELLDIAFVGSPHGLRQIRYAEDKIVQVT
jgi:carbamoyl-phosphate synthase large subunit